MSMKRYLLFGYGSLNVPMIESLTGTRLPHPPRPAYIKNHVRIFAGYSGYWNGAVASLHPFEGRTAYGSVVALTKEEITSLDEYEGVGLGPGEGGYSRVKRAVYIMSKSENGTPRTKKVMAYVYIRNENEYEAPPSKRYIHSIEVNLHTVGNHERDRIPIYGMITSPHDGKKTLVQLVSRTPNKRKRH